MASGKFFSGLRHHADRLLPDYLPALEERKAALEVPALFETRLTPSEAEIFLNTIVTREQCRRLADIIAEYPDGTHHFREEAGSPEDGTRHPHDFIFIKEGDTAKLFFVDPEHSVGKNINRNVGKLPRIGDLRPRVNVLYATELVGETIKKVSLLRYRAEAIPDDSKKLHKPKEQFSMAYRLLDNGELPEEVFYDEDVLRHITFRLDYRADEEDDASRVLIQARKADSSEAIAKMIGDYSHGQTLSRHSPLEGQIQRYRSIMRTHFPRHLEESFEREAKS